MRNLALLCIVALWTLPAAAAGKPQEAYFVKVDSTTMTFASVEFPGLGVRASKIIRVTGLPPQVRVVQRPGPPRASAARRRTYEPIVIRKRVDKSSPLIAQALAKNRTLPRAVLHGRERATGKRVKLTLHGVRIKSQRRRDGARIEKLHIHGSGGPESAAGDADDRPTEEVAFYYNKIAFSYRSTKY